jgi:hypothetical protein
MIEFLLIFCRWQKMVFDEVGGVGYVMLSDAFKPDGNLLIASDFPRNLQTVSIPD